MECFLFRLRKTSANLQRRVWLRLRSVSFFVILTVLLRLRVLQAIRSCAFLKLRVMHLFFLFINSKFYVNTRRIIFGIDMEDWVYVSVLVWGFSCCGNWMCVFLLLSKGLAPEIPEDLYHLIKKAVSIRKHLERNRKDKDSKFRLILVESRIHRLARYYKKTKKLPPVWK